MLAYMYILCADERISTPGAQMAFCANTGSDEDSSEYDDDVEFSLSCKSPKQMITSVSKYIETHSCGFTFTYSFLFALSHTAGKRTCRYSTTF